MGVSFRAGSGVALQRRVGGALQARPLLPFLLGCLIPARVVLSFPASSRGEGCSINEPELALDCVPVLCGRVCVFLFVLFVLFVLWFSFVVVVLGLVFVVSEYFFCMNRRNKEQILFIYLFIGFVRYGLLWV